MTQTTERATTTPTRMSPDRINIEIEPKPGLKPDKPTRVFRWLGWLLAVGVVAIAAIFLIAQATSSDDVTPVPTSVFKDPATIRSDPKPRSPAFAPEATADSGTVWPGIYSPPRTIIAPDTSFPEESTVSPLIYWTPGAP